MDLTQLPSPYYRVATRALILDDQDRLLVMVNKDGEYELPGGGWEYDESFQESLAREIQEEAGVEVARIEEQVVCMYRGRTSHGKMSLRIAVRASLKSYDTHPVEMIRVEWVSQEKFLKLDFTGSGEEGVKEFAQQIWGA